MGSGKAVVVARRPKGTESQVGLLMGPDEGLMGPFRMCVKTWGLGDLTLLPDKVGRDKPVCRRRR